MLIDGVPPENEAGLLLRGNEGTALGTLQPGADPAKDLPAEGPLGKDELSVLAALPGWADVNRLYLIVRNVECAQ